MDTSVVSKTENGFTLTLYPGQNKVLIAMSLADDLVGDKTSPLAGFAIWRTIDGKETVLNNRIEFTVGVSKDTTAADRVWTSSDVAPFQKFRWVDVPTEGFDKPITYRVQAKYFSGAGTALRDGSQLSLTVTPAVPHHKNFTPAFTRGFIASQAYTDKFHNADIRPQGEKKPDFDTKPFAAEYEWLGAGAQKALFDFIADCENDDNCTVDAFIYDIDHPDIISALCRLGTKRKLRAIFDDAKLHSAPNKSGVYPVEVAVAKMVRQAAGNANVKQGHFSRFQHNKVLIKRSKDRKQSIRVLFGSMNFSLRGVYVQANNVIVADDATTAGFFAQAFDVAFEANVQTAAFKKNPVSQKVLVGSATETTELPKFSLTLSPHATAALSLGDVSQRIRSATNSVLFAVMAPTGQGTVLSSLRTIAADPVVFSYGTVETDSGLAVQSPDGAMGDLTSFAALNKSVPPPFNKEFSGGSGMHIHDKFIVVDFAGSNPTVFTGSSNLASGGETSNGDSLVTIDDPDIAAMYAIEAVAMFDHFHFRKAMQKATSAKPLTLWYPGKAGATPWFSSYYDRTRVQMRDRLLFARLPLPPDMETTKTVDWSAIDAVKAPTKKAAKKVSKKASKKATTKTSRARRGTNRTTLKSESVSKRGGGKTRRAPAKKTGARKNSVAKSSRRTTRQR